VKRQLVVIARWPVPGRCKRRLAAGIGRGRAAAVQQRLMAHTLASCVALGDSAGGRLHAEVVVAADPLGPRNAQHWARALGARRGVCQGPGGLGLRMQRQVRRARREGAGQVVLIGSDLPALQPADLQAAFLALEQAPLVLGPASDGGYWLIGLGRGLGAGLGREIFSGMAWGTTTVLEQTLAVARRHGVKPTLLEPHSDLDRAADLQPWR
jgi:rSAM/selenodomain-associated transferase 1